MNDMNEMVLVPGTSGTNEGGKAPYEKPRLRVIELAAEEVLGTSCKSQAGPGQTQAGNGCLSIECKQLLGS